MILRNYDAARDTDDVLRIYREVGWCTKPEHEVVFSALLDSGHTMVAEIDGTAECMVTTDSGTIRHGSRDLPLAGFTSVVTSRIARKRGLAGRLTARMLAEQASSGALVSVLGAFEQGYYNQLGFGNGGYHHWCTFDPSFLNVPVTSRVPVRLATSDWERLHANRRIRLRRNGACNIDSPTITRVDMCWDEDGFGLGYVNDQGELTHHIWCVSKDEHGPYRVVWMAYQTREQFLELMGLLRSFEDQVRAIEMCEPAGLQLQDLLHRPFRARQITRRSPFENSIRATAYWQARLLDLPGAVAQTSLDTEPIRFNLALSDPVDAFLEDTAPWHGVSGDYVIDVGSDSSARIGTDPAMPTLKASVNAFTRMWLGVLPASMIAWTDDLSGPPELLEKLDRAFRLPPPSPDWDF